MEELLPGTTMLPDAAEQVAGDRRQQVVMAKLPNVEQGQHDVQPCLRSECLGDRHAAVQLDDRGGADLGQTVVERGDADPVGVLGGGGATVAGGDGSLQGVRPGAAAQLVDALEGGKSAADEEVVRRPTTSPWAWTRSSGLSWKRASRLSTRSTVRPIGSVR
jgi:hypothetical protein